MDILDQWRTRLIYFQNTDPINVFFYIRYGAAMALGIACSGTGNKEALGLIEPMKNDPVNYVRQGALIASAMVLVQQTEVTCPKVRDITFFSGLR